MTLKEGIARIGRALIEDDIFTLGKHTRRHHDMSSWMIVWIGKMMNEKIVWKKEKGVFSVGSIAYNTRAVECWGFLNIDSWMCDKRLCGTDMCPTIHVWKKFIAIVASVSLGITRKESKIAWVGTREILDLKVIFREKEGDFKF